LIKECKEEKGGENRGDMDMLKEHGKGLGQEECWRSERDCPHWSWLIERRKEEKGGENRGGTGMLNKHE